jgi:hypothetical protein
VRSGAERKRNLPMRTVSGRTSAPKHQASSTLPTFVAPLRTGPVRFPLADLVADTGRTITLEHYQQWLQTGDLP